MVVQSESDGAHFLYCFSFFLLINKVYFFFQKDEFNEEMAPAKGSDSSIVPCMAPLWSLFYAHHSDFLSSFARILTCELECLAQKGFVLTSTFF